MSKIYLILILMITIASVSRADLDEYNYHIRLGWVGNSDMDLIMRNPKDANSDLAIAPLDCYEGQPNPEWGISDQTFDDPVWSSTQVNGTNYEHILAKDLFDIGTYGLIIKAFTGEAECVLDILRWDGEDENSRTIKSLTTDTLAGTREWKSSRSSRYYNMFSRVLKFTQSNNGKYTLTCNYGKLDYELNTNDPIRVYINEDKVYNDEGNWNHNKSGKKYWIDKPWSAKVFMINKNEFKIRGISKTIYKSQHIECTIVIGDYLGTNSFVTNKQKKYKYKEKDYLNY